MIRLDLTNKELDDLAEALDSPEVSERAKRKLLVITMHSQGAQHQFIESCLRISGMGVNSTHLTKSSFATGQVASAVSGLPRPSPRVA